MNDVEMWKVLGIESTSDVDKITSAYRTEVVKYNPEDDPEGFKRLREAYDMALSLVSQKKDSEGSGADTEEDIIPSDLEGEYRELYRDAVQIYDELSTRFDKKLWKELFSRPVCTELDTVDAARETMLRFCMDRYYLPAEIWKLMDDTFQICAEESTVKEIFPEDFIDFVIFRAENEDFFVYDELTTREEFYEALAEKGITMPPLPDYDGASYTRPDFLSDEDIYFREMLAIPSYIDRILFADSEEGRDAAINNMLGMLKYVEESPIFHPFEYTARMRLFFLMDEYQGDAFSMASEVIERSLFPEIDYYLYSTAAYIITALILDSDEEAVEYPFNPEKVSAVIEDVLSDRPDFLLAIIAKTRLQMIDDNYEEANKTLMHVFDFDNRNTEAIDLMMEVNSVLIQKYQSKIEEGAADTEDIIELAWSLYRCDRNEEAIELLQDISPEKQSELFDYHNILGRCYSKIEQYDKALPHLLEWRRLLDELYLRAKADSENLTDKEKIRIRRLGYCYFLIGEAENNLGNYDAAAENMRQAIENEVDKVDIPYYKEHLGTLYAENGDYQLAMEIWDDMLEENQYCTPALIHRQHTAYEMRDAQLVIDDYYKIIGYIPQFVNAYVYAARVFYIYDQYEDVLGVIERAEENGIKDSSELLLLKANTYRLTGKPDDALPIYRHLREEIREGRINLENPADVYINFGYLIAAKGEDPVDLYEEGIRHFPDNSDVFYAYGAYLEGEDKELSKAEKLLSKALELKPEHSMANYKLARIWSDRYTQSEKWENYIKACEYATNQLKRRDDGYYYVERALIYSDGYEFEKAAKDCEEAISQDGDNIYAHNALGYSYMMLKRYADAEREFHRGIEVMQEPELPNLYANLARCCEMQMKYDEAAEYIEKSLEIFGENWSARQKLANIYKKGHRFDKAMEEYQKICDYYQERLIATGNQWYEESIHSIYQDMMRVMLTAGNFKEQDRIFREQLLKLMDKRGILSRSAAKKLTGSDRQIAVYMLKRLGKIQMFEYRDYKAAMKSFEKAISLMPELSKQDMDELDIYFDLNLNVAEILVRLGNVNKARMSASKALEAIQYRNASLEEYLHFAKTRPFRCIDITLLKYILGNSDANVDRLSELAGWTQCSFCRHGACYEGYLTLGKIAEMEHDIDRALVYYEKAAEIAPDDSEIQTALRALDRR